MIHVIRLTYYVVLFVFFCTALITLIAIGKLWFVDNQPDKLQGYPFLWALISSVVLEAAAIVLLFLRTGLKYLPKVEATKTKEATFRFMREYIRHGSSVTIVSNRLSLLTESEDFLNDLIREATNGKRVELITCRELDPALQKQLRAVGVTLYATAESDPPEARFTLINADRTGAERLAIARGTDPEHEITVFDSISGPQMIAMAKDIVKKSKRLSHVP
jgi:hypothetical protein